MIPSIFVMIPAYRDPILEETLDSIFDNAEIPGRVYVAVAAQYDDEVPMPDLSKYPAKNMRVISIHPEKRPGVFRMRHILNKLYFGEDYYLSVDSHTIFRSEWDTKLINLLESRPYYKTIISRYCGEARELTDSYEALDIQVDIGTDGTGPRLHLPGGSFQDWHGEKFISSPYIQAGMFFTRGEFARDVRWGQYWQNEQEEPFLSFEAFMTGWRNEVHMGIHPFDHLPEKYYEAVYTKIPNTQLREFRDNWNSQLDWRPSVCKNIMRAYLYNQGPYRVENAVNEASDFWKYIRLEHEYHSLINNNTSIAY